jgi:L-ascorbate metabolism protein UlaG (beta-lactamase superfamily)
MEETLVYLKSNVVIEPLVDKWYAWAHLISPATAAMNITGRHLKIMKSYIQAPQIHAAAVRNPKMLGGPFMDIPVERMPDVKALYQQTLDDRRELIEFADAIKQLDQLLKQHAKGYSLEPLYEQVPDLLKGYVELVYDLNNNASYRFFEPLLYNSPYYNLDSQSIAMWVTENDERPFVLSTPRMETDGVVHLDIPFNHRFIDEVSRMKRTPQPLSYIKSLVELTPEQAVVFETFFTEEPLPPYKKYDGDKVRMRYFGHACILIETRDISILVDPLVSYYGYASEVDRFSDLDLPDTIDYVLITHNHQDHVLFETLLPLRHRVRNLIVPRSTNGSLQDPNLKLMFNNIGFRNVSEIDELETLRFSDCEIIGVPFVGEHCDLNIKTKLCYHVRVGAFKIMFVADSCNVENRLYEYVQKLTGDADVVLLGMECDGAPMTWLYGPLLTEDLPRDKDQSRRLAGSNYERGRKLVETFNPKEMYVYAMGMEPWLEFISSVRYTDESHPIIASNRLIADCHAKGVVAERLFGEKELFYERNSVAVEELLLEEVWT